MKALNSHPAWAFGSVQAGSESRVDKYLSVEGMPLGKYLVYFAKNELFTYSGDLLLNSAIFHWSVNKEQRSLLTTLS